VAGWFAGVAEVEARFLRACPLFSQGRQMVRNALDSLVQMLPSTGYGLPWNKDRRRVFSQCDRWKCSRLPILAAFANQ
jgi:hypothetical protein